MSDASSKTSKNTVFLSALILAAAAILYLFAVQPAQMSIAKAKRELTGLTDQLRIMERDLKDSARVKGMLAEIDAKQKPYLDALLTPLLESWAMRAKSLLDPIAADVGLSIVDYAEQPVRALPLPKQPPRQLFARRPIRVVCKGSYAEIASFVLRVEKLLPHVALQALQIKAQKEPEEQAAEIVLEWPAKGEQSVPAPPPGGGAKK
jgi:Tfp pilus assembly protein PilO